MKGVDRKYETKKIIRFGDFLTNIKWGDATYLLPWVNMKWQDHWKGYGAKELLCMKTAKAGLKDSLTASYNTKHSVPHDPAGKSFLQH